MAIELREVDSVTVLSLMDNFFDSLIAGTDVALRLRRGWDTFSSAQPRAEHGLAMLVSVAWDGRQESLLLDAGVTPEGVLHNMEAMGVAPVNLRGVVLSHGHADHTGGLRALLRQLGPGLPVHVHPDSFRRRKISLPDREIEMPAVDRAAIEAEGTPFVVTSAPSLLLEDHVLLSGEIARTTEFERGMPSQFAEIDGQWQPDAGTRDDQALVINVRDKGLVVITGCGHAGIVNTLRYAQSLTGVELIYAVIGGFHLSGGAFEQIIPDTVAALQDLAPQVVVPMHCTGWKANHALADALPWAYVPNSVGTQYVL